MSGGADRLEVKRFSMLYQAELAVTLLRSHGIDAQLPDRNMVVTDTLLLNAIGGVRVTAPESQIVEARRILATADSGAVEAAQDEGEWMEDAVPGKVGELDEEEIQGALSSSTLQRTGRAAIMVMLLAFVVGPVAGCVVALALR